MNFRKAPLLAGAGAALVTALLAAPFAAQRPFRVYPSMEPYDDVDLPPDYQEKAEWVFARLMYPQHPRSRFGRYVTAHLLDWRKAVPAGRRITPAPIAISPALSGA